MKIEEIAEKTYRLETPIPGVGLVFSVYLIDVDNGVLIEPGPSAAVPAIQDGMKQLGMRELSWIIPTHIHMDHSGGTGSLAELFPKANVIAHPKSFKHIIDPTRLIRSTRKTYGDNFDSLYGPVLPVSKSRVVVPEDGAKIPVGDRELQIIYAPGHAPHHIAIYDRKTGGLFCGEALGMATDNPLPAPAAPSFNMEDCLNTMQKLKALEPRALYYSHGGAILNPGKRISRAMENTQSYADLILDYMKNGFKKKAMREKITEYAANQFPPEWEYDMIHIWRTGIVEGYSTYFKNKGLA